MHQAQQQALKRLPARPWRRGWLLAASVLLATRAGAGPDALAEVRAKLQARLPDVHIVDVQPRPVAGLFEVFTGDQLVYADASGEHLFVGRLLDTRTREDLAGARLALRQRTDFARLPFAAAIKIVKGDGRRQLAIFADPDCPYCRQLERELITIDDITVWVFLFPIGELHPGAEARARAIWCAPDRAAAWTQWIQQHSEPPAAPAGCAAEPLAQLRALSEALYIEATPTLFLESGERLQGLQPAARLVERLDAARQARVGHAAAAN